MLNPPVCRELCRQVQLTFFRWYNPLIGRGFENPLSALNEASRDPIGDREYGFEGTVHLRVPFFSAVNC